MRRFSRSRYFDARRHGSVHTRRLGMLTIGVVVGLVMVTLAWQATPAQSDRRVLFEQPPAVAPTAITDLGTPQPNAPTFAPIGGGAPLDFAQAVPTPQPAVPPLYDDLRFTSEPNLTVPALQAVLDAHPGPLKSTLLPVGDRNQSVAEVVAGQAYLYSLNPKILLALLEYQQQLLSNPAPGPEQLDWALNYHGEDEQWRGVLDQIRWAARELRRGVRDYPYVTELVYAPRGEGDSEEEVKGPIPAGLNPSSYAVVRVLAQTTTPEQLPQAMNDFLATYSALFEDPRQPLGPLPPPSAPFMRYPLAQQTYVTSFFDHEYPFLTPNGSLVSWWGRRETTVSYDGHDGWDYGARPPDPVLAAAGGTVVWAGNSDDGCGVPARGVVIDHGNGYRTLYWHLSELGVQVEQSVEQGQQIGVVGATGCAIGPHLHFQTQYLGRNTDPYGWCSADADPWSQYAVGVVSTWLWQDRPDPCALPANAIAVTPRSAGFSRSSDGWQPVPIGPDNETLWIMSQTPPMSPTNAITQTISELAGITEPQPTLHAPTPPSTITWRPELPAAGQYRLMAYIPYFVNGLDDATAVRYTIHHAGGSSDVVVSQLVFANDWVDLGTYTFDPAATWVELSNETPEANQGVWAGTLIWVP